MEFNSDITLQQLSGSINRLAIMTGAKAFIESKKEKWISFKIGKNSKKINFVKITLNGKDLYDMEFGRTFRKVDPQYKEMGIKVMRYYYKAIKTHNDVYADQMREIFEKTTGLYLSL
jgi:ribosomal protein L5